jgi:hypothetical protein
LLEFEYIIREINLGKAKVNRVAMLGELIDADIACERGVHETRAVQVDFDAVFVTQVPQLVEELEWQNAAAAVVVRVLDADDASAGAMRVRVVRDHALELL